MSWIVAVQNSRSSRNYVCVFTLWLSIVAVQNSRSSRNEITGRNGAGKIVAVQNSRSSRNLPSNAPSVTRIVAVQNSIYRKIKNPFPVVSTLCRGSSSLWSGAHGGRLGSPIGVPAALIGERGETSLVAGAGPDGVPRCQMRRSPSAATDRVCPAPSQRRSATCGRQSSDPAHPVTLLIQQGVDPKAFPDRCRPT